VIPQQIIVPQEDLHKLQTHVNILSQRLDEVEAQNAQFVTDMIKRSEAQELMMRKIAELEQELLQVKTAQLSVQQVM
jgi:hypothetical protein